MSRGLPDTPPQAPSRYKGRRVWALWLRSMKPSSVRMNSLGRTISQRSKSTSFIGLGRMGHEMAFNLFSKRFAQESDAHFVVCDAIPDSAHAFRNHFLAQFPGARMAIATNPEEAALASKTIITMLPSSPQVKTVYSEGIIPTLRRLPSDVAAQTLCIDSTTLDVTVARAVAGEVIETGAQMVDAPVSGGVTGAKAGTLSFLVGGTLTSFQSSSPLLTFMGQRIIHCGPSGAGLAAKICNNLVLGVEQIVVAEAMLLGQKLGLNPTVLAGVINSSTGACWSSSVNNPVPLALADKAPPCERDYEGGFATALMLKDMGLATNIASESGSPVPLAQAAEDIYAQVIEHQPDLARKDFSSVYRYFATQGDKRKPTA
ncbi:NAD binding domain of 6-phosphogluconate dehydrogenase-domain-containing protein [Infundibulicybe gibba]|nr:NAD binding domain of 6-phosphogluconate dehydrogenase-domain-containing protein [Infundibulicybe gibba]